MYLIEHITVPKELAKALKYKRNHKTQDKEIIVQAGEPSAIEYLSEVIQFPLFFAVIILLVAIL